jgi:hypothetical protein
MFPSRSDRSWACVSGSLYILPGLIDSRGSDAGQRAQGELNQSNLLYDRNVRLVNFLLISDVFRHVCAFNPCKGFGSAAVKASVVY